MKSTAARRINFLKRVVVVLGLASCVLFGIWSPAEAETQSATCEIAENPETRTTRVRCEVRGGLPHKLHTVWLRLKEANPLLVTGAKSTALAPIWAIPDLLTATPSDELKLEYIPTDHCDYLTAPDLCPGTTDLDLLANAFRTDGSGDGRVRVTLDFLLSEGCYPFHEFDGTLSSVELRRVADAFDSEGFPTKDTDGGTIRIVSHPDELGHGVSPGDHLGYWLDWPLYVPEFMGCPPPDYKEDIERGADYEEDIERGGALGAALSFWVFGR